MASPIGKRTNQVAVALSTTLNSQGFKSTQKWGPKIIKALGNYYRRHQELAAGVSDGLRITKLWSLKDAPYKLRAEYAELRANPSVYTAARAIACTLSTTATTATVATASLARAGKDGISIALPIQAIQKLANIYHKIVDIVMVDPVIRAIEENPYSTEWISEHTERLRLTLGQCKLNKIRRLVNQSNNPDHIHRVNTLVQRDLKRHRLAARISALSDIAALVAMALILYFGKDYAAAIFIGYTLTAVTGLYTIHTLKQERIDYLFNDDEIEMAEIKKFEMYELEETLENTTEVLVGRKNKKANQ